MPAACITIRTVAVGWFAVGCIVMIALMNGKPAFSNASRPARGIASPVVALQMARSVKEVDDAIGESPSPDREAMRFKQYVDFAFIACYASLYVALAAMFHSRPATLAAAICGVAAGVLDVVENFAILRIVDVQLAATTQAMIDAIRDPSLAKWTLAFLATALFGWRYFYRTQRNGPCKPVGALNLARRGPGVLRALR